ncbi:hypothetical protein N7G274_008970 [Stereocaulon virgatum]|uniref:Translin n=1 Tax=Stereocaulon virgatum TaxID=373712 RepID=A0ABR3ZZ92_9LECA
MAGTKHPRSDDDMSTPPVSPFMPMFETFRAELDEHHDRRERIIKASRDITALSKKMIFTLQRVRTLCHPLPPPVSKENVPRHAQIMSLFVSITPDLQGLNSWRYQRNISPGIQEYIEAISFQHYLETQQLITFPEAQAKFLHRVRLTEDDLVLGLFDLVGELMRFAITGMATSGALPRRVPAVGEERGEVRDILTDLRSLRTCLESLDMTSRGKDFTPLKRDAEKKMEVMRTCVEKGETAVYGRIIGGGERPKGWMPDLGGVGEVGREVESY